MSPEILTENGFRQLDGEALPIFSRNIEDLTLFYAPGFLAAASGREAEEIRQILSGEIPFGNPDIADLIRFASSARSAWAVIHDPASYRPTCLTIYSSPACNLKCSYCFAEGERDKDVQLDAEFILSSARTVLKNCKEMDIPFTAVFHGGGEPSLDPRMPGLWAELKEMSEKAGVPFFSYTATNGVMDAEKARWIAEHFDAVGLSVDGPPEIQDAQRPLRGGGKSSPAVERTAAILKEVQGCLNVRVTVPPENFCRIPVIAEYCAGMLHADEVHVEPVYCRGAGPDPDLAEDFCRGYLDAKHALEAAGVRLSFSGSRLGEIHGRYCQIFRRVLHLVPPHGTSPCFALSSEREVEQARFCFDRDGITDHSRLIPEDPKCEGCFNRWHCARGCPDVCPALPGELHDEGSFRCRVSRILAEAELLETARGVLFGPARRYGYAGMRLREV